jgi:demethylmenaquinone methyltransferase/2-methoxy-6-polyprenyl-1,4-benzoquinol methylase
MTDMDRNRFSPGDARRFYDLLGERYDWFSGYEARAKSCALGHLELEAGQRVLNVGLGTGKEHAVIQAAVGSRGAAFGLDLSPRMLAAAYKRTQAPLCQADGGRLPFAGDSFERLYCAYVLDLVAHADLAGWLGEFRRVLRPGGRLALVSLTEGVDRSSRAFVSIWKLAYALSPVTCGGCRPLQLSELVRQAGFERVERQVVVQLGIPSEVIVAE